MTAVMFCLLLKMIVHWVERLFFYLLPLIKILQMWLECQVLILCVGGTNNYYSIMYVRLIMFHTSCHLCRKIKCTVD